METQGNLYSSFVAGAKLILPLVAIGILSTLFLLARDPAEEPSIPFSQIEDIARAQRISQPKFAGIADDGSVIAISAREVRPDPESPDAFRILGVDADVDATDGSRIAMTALEGLINPRAATAELTGLARITSSAGYEMETTGILANLKTGEIDSLGPLEVRAPFGEFTAGHLSVRLTEDGTGQQMVFNEGVRLLYQPQP